MNEQGLLAEVCMRQDVLEQVFEATGLPTEALNTELSPFIQKLGKPTEELSMDDLRELMAQYAQDVLLELKRELEK